MAQRLPIRDKDRLRSGTYDLCQWVSADGVVQGPETELRVKALCIKFIYGRRQVPG